MLTFQHGAAELEPVAIAVPIVAAPMLLLLGRVAPRAVLDALALAVAATVVGIVAVVFVASTSGRVVLWAGGWTPHRGDTVGIDLVADPVGAGLALCAGALMLLALVCIAGKVDTIGGHYHALLLLFLTGLVGLALSGDAFDMFGFFELMGAATYGLTGIRVQDESSLQGALNFGIVNSLGAYVSLMGIALLFARTGRLDLAGLGHALAHHRPDALVVGAFCLLLTGFLVKAAVVPFHFWLADAHAVAPAQVCMLFSGVMVPLGVYAVFRIYWVVFAPTIAAGDARRAFLVLGAVTALTGAVMSLQQRRLKRMLSYTTIATTGLVLVALATLTREGTAGAVLSVAAHAGAAGALFLVAGFLLDRYGTMDEHELWGRARRHRVVGAIFVAGGLALSALPPFGTALGNALGVAAGTGLGDRWIPALFVAVPALAGGAVLRTGGRVFLGLGHPPLGAGTQPRARGSGEGSGQDGPSPSAPGARVPPTTVASAVLLLAAALGAGVVPGIRAAATRAAATFVDGRGYVAQALYRAPAHTSVHTTANWAGLGLGLGLDGCSVVLAVGVAGLSLYGRPLLDRLPALRGARRPLAMLARLHSGRVGDYVAWMMVGIAVLAGLVGLPPR